MPTEIYDIIRVFSKFLDPKLVKNLKFSSKSETIKLETIDDIKKLPINAYKFLDEEDANHIKEILDVNTILDASRLNNLKAREKVENQIKIFKNKYPKLGNNLEKVIKLSSIITSVKDDTIKKNKKQQKIVVVGLNNAGKTAIISKFGGKLGIKELAMLKPTKGIKRTIIKESNIDFFILDMGGQKEYRDRYFKNPGQYFIEIDLLIYVIDVQDSAKFESSFDYFENILDIIITMEEKPHFLIFLHKYDPDIKSDPAIQLNVEFLKDNLKELFESKNYSFDYEIFLTSIFSLISNEPQFAKYLKEVMKTTYSLNDPTVKRIEGLGQILEETMNAIIRLSESISIQINDIDNRLRAIEGGTLQIAQSGIPIEIQQNPDVNHYKENTRTKVLNELKDLFDKKKRLDLQ
ncbi:MAG: ADP-ribosylation factor-like protein [Promethearchaeota archaeon]